MSNDSAEILDAALVNMAQKGRIVLCGGISKYNEEEPSPGPRNILELTVRRCRMEGFIVIDFFGRIGEAVAVGCAGLHDRERLDRFGGGPVEAGNADVAAAAYDLAVLHDTIGAVVVRLVQGAAREGDQRLVAHGRGILR